MENTFKSNINQKIVMFIEPAFEAWSQPCKIGNLLMNRFAINEDVANAILKIYHQKEKFYHLYNNTGGFRFTEGMDLGLYESYNMIQFISYES